MVGTAGDAVSNERLLELAWWVHNAIGRHGTAWRAGKVLVELLDEVARLRYLVDGTVSPTLPEEDRA